MGTVHGNDKEGFSPGNQNTGGYTKVSITLHYRRHDGNYSGWNLWVWLEGQNGRMVEFVEESSYARTATFTMEDSNGINRVGFIIRKSTEHNDWASKRFDDRFITSFDDNAHAEVWLVQGIEKIYYHNVTPSIISATLNKWHEIDVKTNLAFDWEHNNITVNLEGASIEEIHVSKDHGSSLLAHQLTIKTKEKLTLQADYRVAISHFGTCDVTYGSIVRTKQFNDEFAYNGTLGAIYTNERTLFRVWSPAAQKATLALYSNAEIKEPSLYPMEKGPNGTWSYDFNGDTHEMVYMFRVKIGKDWHEAVDPYAKAVTVNGEKGVVVDLLKTNPTNWALTKPPFQSIEDAIIYELHVRDASIDPNSGITHKGKFLGLTETNTTTSDGFKTGIDHIVDLGVTHVQLLPINDYWTVDETKNKSSQYNWGYDPKHFNAPEGSYSTDPFQPTSRIIELKKLIQTLHDHGIRVIMDVVYNHVYNVAQSNFHQLAPGYYFRYTKNGLLSNGTGVGSDTASERYMMRKFIVDSLVYWATEYNIDGFRFDLMGIHDIDTMNAARQALDEIDPSIIMLGEGWNLLTPLAEEKKANQLNADKMPRIAHFNDSIRDHLKGNNFFDQDRGFVNGRNGYNDQIKQGISAGMKVHYDRQRFITPNQVVNYVEAHDNHTLWDKLTLTNPGASIEDVKLMHKLATSIVLLSQGIPFLHAGQEFMRTKNGDHNSYRSPDKINMLDWDRKAEFLQEVEYVKGLITLRKFSEAFRMKSRQKIEDSMHFFPTEEHLIAYQLLIHSDVEAYSEYVVIHNAHQQAVLFNLNSVGPWHVLVNGYKAGIEPLSIIKRDRVEVPRLSTLVLTKK